MRVILSCGGTGGHITPALAIAEVILENAPRAEILFVGALGGMEEEVVSAAGYPIKCLQVRGFARRFTLDNLRVLNEARLAVREAGKLLSDFQPDIVIGTGGYASYPVLAAAARAGIPSAVHESNAVPGLAVRRLSTHATRVWLNFAKAADSLPKKASTLVVGNPARRGARKAEAASLPRGCRRMVLSFGGSLGATAINQAALSLASMLAEHPEVYYLHASGKREYESLKAAYGARGLLARENLALLPFITDMPSQMAAADVVIARAGAMTISELAFAERAAILVPSPNVTGNHQYKNARVLADAGAALLLPEEALSISLCDTVEGLLGDDKRRAALSREIGRFATPEAGALIWQDILSLLARKKQ